MIKGTNIGFLNPTKDYTPEDQIQFDTRGKLNLAELWFSFCIEEGIITYIEDIDVHD